MNIVYNNWNNIIFDKVKLDITMGNKIFHLKGENYIKYIYPIANELTYVNSVDRLYSILLKRGEKCINFKEFLFIVDKLLKKKILISIENEIKKENVINSSIVDFSYSGAVKKIKEIFKINSDLYISTCFFEIDDNDIEYIDFYNLEDDIVKIKNNKIIIILINRNNFKIINYFINRKIYGNKYIIPVLIDSNIMIIGSLISDNINIFEKKSFYCQFKKICNEFVTRNNYCSCNDNFIISSLAMLVEEVKKVIDIVDGKIEYSNIMDNSIIYNFNSGRIYSKKFLKYKYELERKILHE